jgi:hypothetical protein
MLKGNSHHRRPDPLLLLAVAVLLCAVMTSAATAGDVFNARPGTGGNHRPQVQDCGFTVASVGNEGAGLSVSLTPPYRMSEGFAREQGMAPKQETLSQVFLYVRYPW